jgi:hypothetical protein
MSRRVLPLDYGAMSGGPGGIRTRIRLSVVRAWSIWCAVAMLNLGQEPKEVPVPLPIGLPGHVEPGAGFEPALSGGF